MAIRNGGAIPVTIKCRLTVCNNSQPPAVAAKCCSVCVNVPIMRISTVSAMILALTFSAAFPIIFTAKPLMLTAIAASAVPCVINFITATP